MADDETRARRDLAVEEYRALRATIRERGTARWIVIVITVVAWAALVVGGALDAGAPYLALAPLLVLAAGFESVFAMHVGAERVGRFLQARYEVSPDDLPHWEHAAMAIGGQPATSAGIDPLGAWLMLSAAAVNVIGLVYTGLDVASAPVPGLLTTVVLHAFFFVRVYRCRRFAARQRAVDLAFFERR
jgi:hypothetical protein